MPIALAAVKHFMSDVWTLDSGLDTVHSSLLPRWKDIIPALADLEVLYVCDHLVSGHYSCGGWKEMVLTR